MDGHHSVFITSWYLDASSAISIDFHHFSSALAGFKFSTDDVAVGTLRKTSLQVASEVSAYGEGDETFVATAEGDLFIAAGPEVFDLRSLHGVSETDHVVDLPPAVLAHPAIGAGASRRTGGQDVAFGVGWRAWNHKKYEIITTGYGHSLRFSGFSMPTLTGVLKVVIG